MIRPILACANPYRTAEKLAAAGWDVDFSQPPESGDPLVGVSLCGNSVLLGVMDGYVSADQIPYVGCGVELYMTVPAERIHQLHESHLALNPTELAAQPWGDQAFEVSIDGYRFMIAAARERSV